MLTHLEAYLVHYQEVMLSNYLLLWNSMKQLQNIQVEIFQGEK